MQLTAKTNYAIRALIDIAHNNICEPKSLDKIAKNQNIQLAFLEQIFKDLKNAEIVQATKGPGGGYALHSNANKLFLIDIFRAMDESYDVTRCKNSESCLKNHNKKCSSHFFLEDLTNIMKNYLSSVSIADLSCKYYNKTH